MEYNMKLSLKSRLKLVLFLIAIPLTCMVLGIMVMISNYSSAYNRLVTNLKIANAYNMSFKQDMEYSMYRVMIGLLDTDKFANGDIIEGKTQYATVVRNPMNMIEEARRDLGEKIERIPGSDGDIKIKGILSCLDSLERAIDRMIGNSKKPGTYDENNSIWENDIQGLCTLIQEYINQYIYYEMVNMETLQRDLETKTRQSMYGFLVVLGGVLVVGTILSNILSRTVTGPINNLRLTAERLGQGDLEARAGMGSLEEINVLARTFNIMSAELAELMEKTKEEQKNLRAAELKLLQAQINPHFLYNTLDSIVWMAEDGDNEKVVEMTSDLSDFFRTVLSGGRDFITIAEEESHIRSYLKIQKIRYEDILDYRINIEESIKDKMVLKMILQPIVENALYHGIKNKRGGGTITIRGYEDKNGLVFEVEDNGRGMDRGTLERLRKIINGGEPQDKRPDGRDSFALANVVQRIYMYYGSSSGLTIESEQDVGTCVKIYISRMDQNHSKKIIPLS